MKPWGKLDEKKPSFFSSGDVLTIVVTIQLAVLIEDAARRLSLWSKEMGKSSMLGCLGVFVWSRLLRIN